MIVPAPVSDHLFGSDHRLRSFGIVTDHRLRVRSSGICAVKSKKPNRYLPALRRRLGMPDTSQQVFFTDRPSC
ncbi:hypothetical protein AKJ16_DCAP05911 [Drosera capensis]